MDTELILERFYRVRPRRKTWRRRLRAHARRMVEWFARQQWRLILGAVTFSIWVAGHVYYYNRLTVLEYDCKVAEAQIIVSREKRHHIQRGMRRLLKHYAAYERELMKDVTKMRATKDAEPSGPPNDDGIGGLLGRLNAVAEQYPSLHLTQTTQQFSTALIASETEISQRVVTYNDAVNRYTTVLNQFPGIVFGRFLGFEMLDFYSPDDDSVLEYRELDL